MPLSTYGWNSLKWHSSWWSWKPQYERDERIFLWTTLRNSSDLESFQNPYTCICTIYIYLICFDYIVFKHQYIYIYLRRVLSSRIAPAAQAVSLKPTRLPWWQWDWWWGTVGLLRAESPSCRWGPILVLRTSVGDHILEDLDVAYDAPS